MNGNDCVEIKEKHYSDIEDAFLLKFSHERLRGFLIEEIGLEAIKEKHEFEEFMDEWVLNYKEKNN